ncbi:polysaccharide pyruvyl transferase family protein [Phocaeicola sartorii]|jgi:hypothetical protein|uniref:polysaccharide pyruvyl transferase family protein n=1 Tax=Phocaeicola sartorii TaxID=671267 RepID=UPI00267074DD|nr:polysaccharide pyruvyl transferase family protein [Phocaeicola sartorii]
MKKIGILTLVTQGGSNYGGLLQCLALQNVLCDLGYDVSVINFMSTEATSVFHKIICRLSSLDGLCDFCGLIKDVFLDSAGILSLKKGEKNKELLEYFEKYRSENLRLTPRVNESNIGNVCCDYDVIIVGSDQVWSGFTKDKLVYLCDWYPVYAGKRISYAACSSRPRVPQIKYAKISRLMKRMDGISVRDNQTANIVKKVCNIDAVQVLDPVFLYDFNHLINDSLSYVEEPYILFYVLGPEISGGYEKMLKLLKAQLGDMKIIAIQLRDHNAKIAKYADVVLSSCLINDWITLIAKARFVVTDSFHGLCFSLKYRRPFIAFYTAAWRASRLLDMKDRFSLDMIVVSSVNDMVQKSSLSFEIDYNVIEQKIKRGREFSLQYLINAIE